MHHKTIQRIAVILSLLLAAASGWFAWSASSSSSKSTSEPTADGATRPTIDLVFSEHCAHCHEVAEFVDALRAHDDQARAVLEMLDFLAEHGTTDALDDRRLVRDWIDRARRP